MLARLILLSQLLIPSLKGFLGNCELFAKYLINNIILYEFKRTVHNLFFNTMNLLWKVLLFCKNKRLKCITLFQKLLLLLNPVLHFLNIFSFPFANACFGQNIVVQHKDTGSSHLEAFSNLGVPPVSHKSYSLKKSENTMANGYCNIRQIPF